MSLVIGNGESRRGIDIDSINTTKIGCNAILRDFKVNHLVCVDRKMVREAVSTNYQSLIYTRKDWASEFQHIPLVKEVPELPYHGTERHDEPFQWGSGPYAVLVGAIYTKTNTVDLIGFDLHSKTPTVNNIYKGTPNYIDADKRAVDPRYWIHQIGMVFKCFPKIQFTIYQDDWELPESWNYPNVMVDKISKIRYN